MAPRKVRRSLAAALLAGVAAMPILVTASPAAAHNPRYNCTHWWLQGAEGAQGNCAGGVSGDQFRLKLVCQRAGGTGLQTKYSAWRTNGTSTLYCSTGYEGYSKQIHIIFADGHGKIV